MKKTGIYLAGPLFCEAEVIWAGRLKERMETAFGDRVEVIWPHEIASGTSEEIFKTDLAALKRCPLMVAILDGPQVDGGTSWEVGCHYTLFGKKGAIGIRTDFRKAGEMDDLKVNLMVERFLQGDRRRVRRAHIRTGKGFGIAHPNTQT